MTAPTVPTRAERAENYRIKRESGFRCEGCGKGDQLLAVDLPAEDRSTTLCEDCIPDRRTHRVRPGQWNEAEARAEAAKAKG